MIRKLSVAVSILLTSTFALALSVDGRRYPEGPNPEMTPGAICQNSSTYRYPEHIKYCERDVDGSLKKEIIRDYDQQFGYEIQRMDRQDFKIDHLIPLSIGGANTKENLWPQHKSVYQYSDPIESHVANLIAQAKIKQAEAIRVVKECKLNLGRCEELQSYLESLY